MVFGLFKKKGEEKKLLEKTFPTEKLPGKPFIKEKIEMPMPMPREEKLEAPVLEEKPPFPEIPKPKAKKLPQETVCIHTGAVPLLGDLCSKVEKESRKLRNYVKEVMSKVSSLTLESPEIFELVEAYVKGKKKLEKFLGEMNKLDFSNLEEEERVMVAVYKFRICKTLSEIKQQILRIEGICRKVGFVPSEVQEILRANAEELINRFMRERRVTQSYSIPMKSDGRIDKR